MINTLRYCSVIVLCLVSINLIAETDLIPKSTRALSTEKEQVEKKVLFNGKNLEEWVGWSRKVGKVGNAEKLFEVSDGMIRMHGDFVGYIRSKKTYSDFELTLQFRWNTDSKYQPQKDIKNSGVMYLVDKRADDTVFPRGVQYQIKTGGTGDFILIKDPVMEIRSKVYGPGLSLVIPRTVDAEKAVGEWNTIKIRSAEGYIVQKLNGVIVNEGINCTEKEGRILICYEKAPIDFKDVVITEL